MGRREMELKRRPWPGDTHSGKRAPARAAAWGAQAEERGSSLLLALILLMLVSVLAISLLFTVDVDLKTSRNYADSVVTIHDADSAINELQWRLNLKQVSRAYDYVILDCGPSLNLLNQNALSYADGDRSVPLEDPMTLLVADFVAMLQNGGSPNARERHREIVDRMALLDALRAAWPGPPG